MKVTEPLRQTILARLKTLGMSQADFAHRMGYGRAWASKLLKPGPASLKTIDDETLDRIETTLGATLHTYSERGKEVPAMALDITKALDRRPDLAKALSAILELAEPETIYAIPNLSNSKLEKIGARATQIVSEWENGKEPHFTKIGLELVVFLREMIEEEVS